MGILTGLTVFVVVFAALFAQGRPSHFLGFFCLVGLACVVAVSGLIGLLRPNRRVPALVRSR